MLFNTLGVAACACLFTKRPIQIDWWPITRDSILFSSFLVTLTVIAWDSRIYWWETCILVSLYVFYWIFMFQNPRVMKFFKKIVEDRLLWCQRIKNYDIVNQQPKESNETSEDSESKNEEIKNGLENPTFEGSSKDIYTISTFENYRKRTESVDFTDYARRPSTDFAEIYATMDEEDFKIWQIPRNVSKFQIFWFFFTWPIRFSLHYTIPHPIKYKKLFPLSFLMCVIWIGLSSYMVFWMVVIIGDTFGIPDPIMGLTFLAFGGCMPEAISAVIVARKGSGQMGVSNALGANCLAILFSLGLPWFINTMIEGAGRTGAFIKIYSYAMEFTISAIIFAVLTLYIVIAAAGYKLRKTVGVILGISYVIFATYAILVELGILFEPSC
jgi:solute carrier family 24 (sodium/potassium/calcium exchanger), member 4